jgi:hypothetical protein
MNKQEIITTIDKMVREVSQVFSQNSTALAREYTLKNAINTITDLVLRAVSEENNSNETSSKNTKSAKPIK